MARPANTGSPVIVANIAADATLAMAAAASSRTNASSVDVDARGRIESSSASLNWSAASLFTWEISEETSEPFTAVAL
jgi:hypothetical protein